MGILLTTRVLVALNAVSSSKWYQAGGSLIKPGYVVTEDDADEVKICGTSDKPLGVAGCPAYHDLNTVYTAGVRVPVFLINSGVEIFVCCDGTTGEAITKGTLLMRSANTAGHVQLSTVWAAPDTTTYAATDFTEDMMTDHFIVGTSAETYTVISGTIYWIPCLLGR